MLYCLFFFKIVKVMLSLVLLCPSHVLSVLCALTSRGASLPLLMIDVVSDILVLNCPGAAHVVKTRNA